MKKVIFYIDGGAVGNPGPAAIGVVLCNEKKEVVRTFSQKIGQKTNNEAEYSAAIFALSKFKSLFGKKIAKETEVEIRSDSQLLVNQMNGKFKILDEKIKPFFIELWNQKLDFKKVSFVLVPRNQNNLADSLVKKELQE
jgi:ribonuclease HI/probable phosphoglycerate mutase